MDRIRIGLAEAGREVAVRATERVLLALPENPTTGFRWSIAALEGPLSVTDDRYEPAGDAAVGAAATRLLELTPSAPGPASIALQRWREWEGPASIEARFSCSFVIAAPEER